MEPTTEFSPAELRRILQIRQISTPHLDKLLIDNNAIIAGGSVLSSVITRSYESQDIDLYVNLRNAQNIYNTLIRHWGAKLNDSHSAPPYDYSFLIKNNILGRFNVSLGSRPPWSLVKIDVMIVDNEFTPQSVVDNFDLSFCKIWYDGKTILIIKIVNKNNTLGIDYLRAYLSGNSFTYKRIQKYISRGFTINLPNIDTSSIIMRKPKKQVLSPEIWVVYKLVEQLLIFLEICTRNGRTEVAPHNIKSISNTIIILEKLSEFKRDNGLSTMYNIDGFKYLLRVLYLTKLTRFWTVDKLIYELICTSYSDLCEWITPKYAEYFKSIGIQITEKDGVLAHGFDNYKIPMCDGKLPPFSAGESGIPENAIIL